MTSVAAGAEVAQRVGAVERAQHLARDEGPGDLVVAVPLVGEGVLVLDRRDVELEEDLLGPALGALVDHVGPLDALGPLGVGGEVADDLHDRVGLGVDDDRGRGLFGHRDPLLIRLVDSLVIGRMRRLRAYRIHSSHPVGGNLPPEPSRPPRRTAAGSTQEAPVREFSTPLTDRDPGHREPHRRRRRQRPRGRLRRRVQPPYRRRVGGRHRRASSSPRSAPSPRDWSRPVSRRVTGSR